MGNVESPSEALLRALLSLSREDEVTNVGEGELVTVDDTRDDGLRSVRLGKDDRFEETYRDDFLPTPSFTMKAAETNTPLP